jgi:hypothetical protein
MLTSALGHRASLAAIMEFARSGRQLNINSKDDSEFTALEYAAVSGNGGLMDTIRGRTKTTPAPVKLTGSKMTYSSTNVNNNTRALNNNNNINNNNNNNVRGKDKQSAQTVR